MMLMAHGTAFWVRFVWVELPGHRMQRALDSRNDSGWLELPDGGSDRRTRIPEPSGYPSPVEGVRSPQAVRSTASYVLVREVVVVLLCSMHTSPGRVCALRRGRRHQVPV
ncbi:hypothetical protein GY45DRAFT_501941 [Cubamyces sp. BRFM 1775]|nr:hypothetical protein GY45DRAFT_501941 [Cubamyces sp. BRFM 1775]